MSMGYGPRDTPEDAAYGQGYDAGYEALKKSLTREQEINRMLTEALERVVLSVKPLLEIGKLAEYKDVASEALTKQKEMRDGKT